MVDGRAAEAAEVCGESTTAAAAAPCFIFCHGAFSAALRLPVIYHLTAASSLRRVQHVCVCVCVTTRLEIDDVGDI